MMNLWKKVMVGGLLAAVLCVWAFEAAGETDQTKLGKHLTAFKQSARSFERGIKALAERNTVKAKRAFRYCLKKMPEHAYAHYHLAALLYSEQDYPGASKHIKKAIDSLEFMQQLNRFALEKKYDRMTEQMRLTEESVEYAVNCVEAAKRRDGADAIKDRITVLDERMKRIAGAERLKSAYLYFYGNILFQLKQFPEAVGRYVEAVKLNPRNWEAYNNLAGIFFLGKDYQRALGYIEMAESRGAGSNVNLELKKQVYDALGKPDPGILEREYPGVKCFVLNIKTGRSAAAGSERFYENCYVVFDEVSKHAVIVDPGVVDPRIDIFIAERGLEVKRILNTHGHSDHIGGNVYYSRKYRVDVMVHEADASYYNDLKGDHRPNGFFRHGEVIDTGGLSLRVIHTPGHSPGSVCFWVDGKLISGDTLFKDGVGWVFADTEAERDKKRERLAETIRAKLFVLPGETPVYPGHGDPTTVKREKTF